MNLHMNAEIGVFGGSGFTTFLDALEELELDTPYGKPSAPLVVGELAGRRVAFCPRHGRRHELPPHAIPYRANLWAMRKLGVEWILGPTASGALRPDLALGEFVVCDQFVDLTRGRADTFYDGPETTHVSAADPYCPLLRGVLVETARELDIPVRDGGTVVTIQGPRFEENNARLRELLFAAIPKIPRERPEHLCSTALRGARVAPE
jgi:5'-methylthioadenosine phosphorylase